MTVEDVDRIVRRQAESNLGVVSHGISLQDALIRPKLITIIDRIVKGGRVTDKELSVWLVGHERSDVGYLIVMREHDRMFGLAGRGSRRTGIQSWPAGMAALPVPSGACEVGCTPASQRRRISDSRYNSAMSPNAQRLLAEIRQLPPDEREWLIESALMEGDGSTPMQVEAAWDEEIKRRLDEIDSGTVKMISHEEFMADLDAHITSKRKA